MKTLDLRSQNVYTFYKLSILNGECVTLLIVDHVDVRKILNIEVCIDLMREAAREISSRDARLPIRSTMEIGSEDECLSMMPGALSDGVTVGIKVSTVIPGNSSRGMSPHQGYVLLFDGNDGRPAGIVDGGILTAIRTAAATAVATDALARPDASVFAFLGAGEQALMHLEALSKVRHMSQARVWSRSSYRRTAFAERGEALGLNVTTCSTVNAAVANADVISTLTSSNEPVLPGALLEPGMHINAVGSSIPTAREIDDRAVARVAMFVDFAPAVAVLGAEYRSALQAGDIGPQHIKAEIGEVLDGRHPGRTRADEITLYKSLGVSAQDIVAARFVLGRARELGVGTNLLNRSEVCDVPFTTVPF